MNQKMCKLLRKIAKRSAFQMDLPKEGYQKNNVTGAIRVDPKTEKGVYRMYKKLTRKMS